MASGEKVSPALIAGYGIGNFLFNALFTSVAFGLNGALETFVSQAFGSNKLELCSSYLHRSRLLVTVLFVITFVVLIRMEKFLVKVGQDSEAAGFAIRFIYTNGFGYYMIIMNDGTRRFLNSMSLSSIPFKICIFCTFSQIVFCEIFVKWRGMGMMGLGISTGLANFLSFICLNVYPLFVKEARPAMRLPGTDALKGIYEYLSMGLPLCLMSFFEWVSYELMIIMSGYLGVASQAT